MIKGIGIDIIELKRIERMLKNPKFLDRILTSREKELLDNVSPARKVEIAAGRFAGKEAYAKACGTGISKETGFHDIEILPDEKGVPKITGKNQSERLHISISHSTEYAVAQVIIEE
ncbi:holo-ACP synthase [Bacillus sp. FJAT-44742]|uniref:holo-ACP synthase n=1 Tax=Bacillus sp. FJAT-44742 TaxID=2014005 RepID=UPI000C24BF14|nr:holo-ACP synthase [Bacillus sp. FJAT-44742]